MTRLDKLLSIASAPILAAPPTGLMSGASMKQGQRLLEMLTSRNGFYAFEGALHVFSDGRPIGDRGLEEWNSNALWRDAYDDLSSEVVFFAEDAFGIQFCLIDNSISTFDPETGAIEVIAATLEDWAAAILDDYRMLTGYPVAHDWQAANGPLPRGHRLVPKIPFVLGGEFSVGNVHSLDAVEGMRVRASIARQIRDLPDGTKIQLKTVD